MKKVNNTIHLENDEPKDICKLGQGEECCTFLVCYPGGFECIKKEFPMGSLIHERLKQGTMNAKGQGKWPGCPWENNENEDD
jgi:hypothetical protein